MSKSIHNEGVPRPGDKIHIPLPEDEALRLLGKVKPTKDMPRPGATKRKASGELKTDRRTGNRR